MANQVDICNLALRRLGANTITLITDSTKEAEHCNSFWAYVLDEVLEQIPWNFNLETRKLNYAAGYGFIDEDNDQKTITGISAADPAVIDCVGHGISTGQHVHLADIVGMTELNGATYFATATTVDVVTLTGIDSSLFTAYVSGGYLIRREPSAEYAGGYTYDLPADYQVGLHLDCGTRFVVEGNGDNRRLMTVASDAFLHYISSSSTVANYQTRFVSTLAYRLAAELALPLGKKGARQKEMLQLYEHQMGKRAVVDASEKKDKPEEKDPWLTAGGFSV